MSASEHSLFASRAILAKEAETVLPFPLQTLADPHQKPAVRPRRRSRRGLLAFVLLIGLVIGVIAYPPTFLYLTRQFLTYQALRYGYRLTIGDMSGHAAGPITLYNARLTNNSGDGTSTRLDIDRATTDFAWQHLFWRRDIPVWHALTIDGMRGDFDLAAKPIPQSRATIAGFFHPRGPGKTPRVLLPSSLIVRGASIVVRHGGDSVSLANADLETSDTDTGHLDIGTLAINEPWMSNVFANCHGELLLQDSMLKLAGMKLTDAVTITSASADLPSLLRGQLQMEFALAAFSGNIQGDLHSGAREDHLTFESSGTFANISVAQLGAFFGEDADGTIKQGKFTFRGSPRDLEKATFTTRFEAGDFRWGARRWTSLVAGATYVNHRLLIPEFQLRQAHNSLMLKGDMSVPGNWREWWKTSFSFVVSAQIDSLTELSALLGPEFGDTFGKLTVDGSVRGENASFNGQLIVSGSHLSFRKAPLDQLQAAIKLEGNEIQVTSAEFTHGDDFLRAQGVVNILGEKRYWGEVKASIADLALYSSFLQPPIAPEAFGGGLMLDWSGDGAPSAHSGAFTVRLNRIHPLVAAGAEPSGWQPIDLNAEGTYSPESIFFSNLALGNGDTTLASRVVANPSSLTLEDLKLTHGKATWLTGSAQVPLNVWAAWEHPGTASWWNFQRPCKLNLVLDRLSVRDTLLLSGRPQPFDGEITGDLKSNGTLASLTADGHLTIKNAAVVVPAGVLKTANADLEFKGPQVTVNSASGNWDSLDWTATGAVTASDVRAPALNLAIKLPSAPVTLGPGIETSSSLDLHATGPLETLALSGASQIKTAQVKDAASLASLVTDGGTGLRDPLPPLAIPGPPAWTLNVTTSGTALVNFGEASGKAMPSLALAGSLAHPTVSGNIAFKGFTITEGPDKLAISDGAIFLNPRDPPASTLTLHAAGVAGDDDFDGYIYGSLAFKHFTWDGHITDSLAGKPGPATPAAPAPRTLPLGAIPPAVAPSATPPPGSAKP